jgi:Ion channel
MGYLTDPNSWIVVAATLVAVTLVSGLHFEVLSHCSRLLPVVSPQRRRRVLFLIMIILVTHVVEIWIFAVGYYALTSSGSFGRLTSTILDQGLNMSSLFDFVYYSAMVYTTVGFGDVVPTGAIRFMTGMEALTGLVMITWSASFTYLEMQRDWPSGRRA